MKQEIIKNDIYSKESVFSLDNLYKSSAKCDNNVKWKPSVIQYNTRLTLHLIETFNKTLDETYSPSGEFNEFYINERGKIRFIRAPRYSERIVQKCLCDNCLNPILVNSLIAHNGACIKGKGVGYARSEFKRDLNRLLLNSEYKEKYILFIDFKKYFDNIDHNVLIDMLRPYLIDKYIHKITAEHINSFGEKGLGLGSQVSQILSVFYSSSLDHYVTNYLHRNLYGRYMDDIYVMGGSKEELEEIRELMRKYCEERLHIKFSEHKVKIVKINTEHNRLTRIKYLKCDYLIKDFKIIKVFGGAGSAHIRERRKLNALHDKLLKQETTLTYIENMYKGWRYSMVSQFDNVMGIAMMDNYYMMLFGKNSLERVQTVKKYYKNDYINKKREIHLMNDKLIYYPKTDSWEST